MNFLFKYFVKDQLIFNTSWEDPAIDRRLLRLDNSSDIITITSAGDNILDYLLDSPNSITAVDLNPAQNCLANLKFCTIANANYEVHFDLFGKGKYPNFNSLLEDLKSQMPHRVYEFWRKRVHYFTSEKSFYHYGTSGLIARGFYYHLRSSKDLRIKIDLLLESNTIEEQYHRYLDIEKKLFDNFIAKFLLNNRFALSFFGIPDEQAILIEKYNEYGNMYDFIVGSLRTVFREFALSDNYFWYLYINGNYSHRTCPNYLRQENFDLLRENVGKVELVTDTFYNKLKNSPTQSYSHFILLDHFDWFWKNKQQQKAVWTEIKRTAKPNAKILFRSAADRRDFLINEIRSEIQFDDESTSGFRNRGRVGTYGSINFGEIK